MKKKTEIYENVISPAAIDECSDKVRQYSSSLKLSGKDIQKYAISVEEILLDSLESGDCDKFRLSTGKRFFKNCITLEIFGKQKNVFQKKQTGSLFGDSILKNLGLSPEYYYSENTNTYQFRISDKSVNPITKLAIAVVLAVVVGLAGNLFAPASFIDGINNNFLTPLHNTFLNMLGCIAGPMIFLSVAWGIYGIGDAATLKKVGKKLLRGYVGSVFASTIIFSLFFLLFFGLKLSSKNTGVSELSSVLNMLLGIIPKNIFSPFTEGNTLQIIFLAIVIGIALLFLGKKTTAVTVAVEQINLIVQYLIELISKLVPYFIFVVLVELIWSDSLSSITGTGKYFITAFLSSIVLGILLLLISSIRMKTNPVLLAKKGLSTFIIALTTASSAAAFNTNINACRNRYGISDSISSFGVPLGMVAFKPATAITYVATATFFAYTYKVEISFTWVLMMIFSAAILAIATPPIPGGSMTAYTVLFSQLGIPMQAIAVVLAYDALFDFITTAVDEFALPLEILPRVSKLGMVDKTILKNKNYI